MRRAERGARSGTEHVAEQSRAEHVAEQSSMERPSTYVKIHLE